MMKSGMKLVRDEDMARDLELIPIDILLVTQYLS